MMENAIFAFYAFLAMVFLYIGAVVIIIMTLIGGVAGLKWLYITARDNINKGD